MKQQTISGLISQLQKVLERFGDLPVGVLALDDKCTLTNVSFLFEATEDPTKPTAVALVDSETAACGEKMS